MEGVFFVLIGAALFTQSWSVLGMYSEGRTTGVLIGGLGVISLLALMSSAFAPVLLTGTGGGAGADMLTENTIIKALVMVWAIYAVAVGAHGLWDFEDRAIGFYSAFLAVATLVVFSYFVAELEIRYNVETWLALSGASLILTVLATTMFFYLALAFNVLRLVAGWFLLLGGGIVTAIGFAIVTAAVTSG